MDKLSIIIPLYNPHPGWEINFSEALTNLGKKLIDADFSIILVNDGSTRKISMLDELMEHFSCLKYFSYPTNMGKGYAIRYGAGKADADYYFYTDADFPFGDDVIIQAYRALKSSNVNLIIGIRDKNYFRALPVERKVISYLLKVFSSMVTGFKLKDTQAPLKGMDNKARQVLINSKINGFIFDFEFLINCLKQDISFIPISITPRHGIVFTDFSIKTLKKEIINLLKTIF
jgi:cellulose synthase/poly-beta-1,6-N-acetylglucosamine synthase-like glycosyltransferase